MTTRCKTMIMQVQTCHITLLTFAIFFWIHGASTPVIRGILHGMCAWAPAGGGQEGALAPPWKFKDMGGPPKDNLTRN